MTQIYLFILAILVAWVLWGIFTFYKKFLGDKDPAAIDKFAMAPLLFIAKIIDKISK